VMMTAAHIDKGRLSFCFKSLGNIVRCLFNDCSMTVRVCSEFVRGCVCSPRGLARIASELFDDCSGMCLLSEGVSSDRFGVVRELSSLLRDLRGLSSIFPSFDHSLDNPLIMAYSFIYR